MNNLLENNLELRVFATLRKLCEPVSKGQFPKDIRIEEILDIKGIPRDKVAVIFINGRHADLDSIPVDGDTISLFPAVGGG